MGERNKKVFECSTQLERLFTRLTILVEKRFFSSNYYQRLSEEMLIQRKQYKYEQTDKIKLKLGSTELFNRDILNINLFFLQIVANFFHM